MLNILNVCLEYMIPRSLFYFAFIALAIGIVYYFIQDYKNFIKSENKHNVIIVGGGLAGLSSTIEAVRSGANVILIEKEKMLGGNSAKATSGINGAGSDTQLKSGITDIAQNLFEDTISSGGGESNENLVRVLADHSADAIKFLKSFGINLDDVVQLGGHRIARTHRIPPAPDGRPFPVGFTIMSTLKKHVETNLKDHVKILLESCFHKLIFDEGEVIGLFYKDINGKIHELAGQVILTAGGFGNDHTDDSLLTKYVPHLQNLPTTNGAWATGDIIKSTFNNDLDLVHMQHVQVHPTGFLEISNPLNPTKFLAPEALRGVGGILLDRDGRRFVNELGRRDYVTEEIFKSNQRFKNDTNMPIISIILLNQDMIQRFGTGASGFYKSKGLIIGPKSLEAIAELTQFSYDILKNTIEEYRIAAISGQDKFGKKSFPIGFSDTDDFYIAYVTPSVHYTMGGISIDSKARVLKKSKPVEGLFAAGEVSGGVHGENRLGGNSLLECVVFGRIAGKNAAS